MEKEQKLIAIALPEIVFHPVKERPDALVAKKSLNWLLNFEDNDEIDIEKAAQSIRQNSDEAYGLFVETLDTDKDGKVTAHDFFEKIKVFNELYPEKDFKKKIRRPHQRVGIS